jgi:hypothetical protein
MPEKYELNRKAEELLDRALARYAGEPLVGLENRTLARLRKAEEVTVARFFSKARWTRRLAALTAATVAVAASLVIGIQIGQHRADLVWQQRVANGGWNAVRPVGTVTVNVPPAPAVSTVRAPRKAARRDFPPQLAKQPAQFPSPVPMSAQERSLAQLASTADPALLSSLAQAMQPSPAVQAETVQQNDSQPRPPQ